MIKIYENTYILLRRRIKQSQTTRRIRKLFFTAHTSENIKFVQNCQMFRDLVSKEI
jgi:hypothetical protein